MASPQKSVALLSGDHVLSLFAAARFAARETHLGSGSDRIPMLWGTGARQMAEVKLSMVWYLLVIAEIKIVNWVKTIIKLLVKNH